MKIKHHSNDNAWYPVQLEEAFNLLTFSSGAADQEVTKLVYWSQFLKDVTSLKDNQTSKTEFTPQQDYNMMSYDFNLCRQKDKLLWRDIVLLDNHRGVSDGDMVLV